MGALITLDDSVGANARNLPQAVIKIGAALTAIGPDRGGVFAPPLSTSGLAEAIKSFQEAQGLPAKDGKVDKAGATLRRINAILNPGASPSPAPAPKPSRSGAIRRLASRPGMGEAVSGNVWAPIDTSLSSEMVFKWAGVSGKGRVFYFELDEDVVPNWFGVLVPNGVAVSGKVHIFFHPTTSQAGFKDANYASKTGWAGLFHYMTSNMAVQFCAAGTGQVLVMPLMNQTSAGDCGVFPQRWESLVGEMLGQIGGAGGPVPITSVVVSSFSSGIVYNAQFRSRAQLGGRLRGVIDFDGIISTNRRFSQALGSGNGCPVVRMQQTDGHPSTIAPLSRQGVFPLSRPRWGEPWQNSFSKDPKQALMQIHATIPQTMMFPAALRTRGD